MLKIGSLKIFQLYWWQLAFNCHVIRPNNFLTAMLEYINKLIFLVQHIIKNLGGAIATCPLQLLIFQCILLNILAFQSAFAIIPAKFAHPQTRAPYCTSLAKSFMGNHLTIMQEFTAMQPIRSNVLSHSNSMTWSSTGLKPGQYH